MNTRIIQYVFLRFFGIFLLGLSIWNLYLLRLLDDWSVIDLVQIFLEVAGIFCLSSLILWGARIIKRKSDPSELVGIRSVHQTLNFLFLVSVIPFMIGDILAVISFYLTVSLESGGTVSDSAYLVRDVAILRASAFFFLQGYLLVGAIGRTR